MSDFKAKIHQIRFRLGLRPRPHWGSLQRSQTPKLDLRGLLLRAGEEGQGRGGERREGRGEEWEEWGLIRASIRSPYFFRGSTPMSGSADPFLFMRIWLWLSLPSVYVLFVQAKLYK